MVDHRSLGLGLACANCFVEGEPVAFLAEIDRRNLEAWERLPAEDGALVSDPEAERSLRAAAMELRSCGVRPDVAETALLAINQLRASQGRPSAGEADVRRLARQAEGTLRRHPKGS